MPRFFSPVVFIFFLWYYHMRTSAKKEAGQTKINCHTFVDEKVRQLTF